MSQATPKIPGDDGPTDCVNCGKRIRRFGQTRRWCHDETGNVECSVHADGLIEPQQFEIRHVTLERDLRHSNSPIGDRLVYEHNRAVRELEDAVVAAGFQFNQDDVFVELQLTYRATVCACGIDVTSAKAHREGCPRKAASWRNRGHPTQRWVTGAP